MGAHLINGEFQSDKYPTCPRGKVPLSVKDPTAQDLLWEYAQRRRAVDSEFATDLEEALRRAGFDPAIAAAARKPLEERIAQLEHAICPHCKTLGPPDSVMPLGPDKGEPAHLTANGHGWFICRLAATRTPMQEK